ncbi:DNA phosphorothioation-dependent restriction protein DptG [Clostridium botulinum]|uniref:DNA phosphorothioation-dependent restriction protein DptG n=1 Tax=Clostridium botulinum TaxID=1491 RepID=UPI0007743353|nr:DNA phosphorothioation-dependent restriction protein DptG [Clostridium botulinum]MBY6931217.1 DNA phosphorothioation-dependent restriction protein DptG [Clostridium botulinum]NFG21570.1 DNA phosphorothioation-dependent restriction protein DptG [Clostridium botulinum]NFO82182.1 DNA phosphorothioation-dependent restriction protein DptG [Clostridium botulinum]
MEDKRSYELDLDIIKKDFKFATEDKIIEGNYNLRHKQRNRFKMLPYTTKKENIVLDFYGVIGTFSRNICDKKLKNIFNVDEFIANILDEVEEVEGENSKQDLKNIIKTMYINDNKLVNFDIKTMNYIESSTHEEKVAEFLFSIFIDSELKESISKFYDKPNNNILNRLVLKALPDLSNNKGDIEEYKCYIPFIKELFKKDIMFLISNEELYKGSVQRVLEYYNMFYISQLSIKLSQFEKADLNKPEPLYYTLSWESTSKNRTAYRLGLENLKESISCLFSHAIVLELLNCNDSNKQFGYVDLYELFKDNDDMKMAGDIKNLIEEYKKRICDIKWEGLKEVRDRCDNDVINEIYRLFITVNYQFINSKKNRNDLYTNYQNWFMKFIENNFGKRRGSLGYNLNLTEEDIILLTKICINNNEKLKVSVLFKEFENRGIFFDRDSKTKIIQLYEKLNLLEKKSDSGDAQYVKSVL